MHQDPVQMAMLGGVRSEAETVAYMTRNLAHWDQYGFGLWVLRDREHGEVIGRALLRHLALGSEDEVELGYGFQPAQWGRGLATEIASACLRYGLTDLGLSTLVALTMPNNLASQRVLEKIGMARQGLVEHDGKEHLLYRFKNREEGE